MLQNNAYLPAVSAKVPWQRCLAGKGSTVPSPDRGSVAGSSARTTTSSWASTPTLAASKAIVPGFTLAGSGATVHSESSTVTWVSAVLASPTGLQTTAAEPEAVPLPDPDPLAPPLPDGAPESTVRTPVPASAAQPARSSSIAMPGPARRRAIRLPIPRSPPTLGLPNSDVREPYAGGDGVVQPAMRPATAAVGASPVAAPGGSPVAAPGGSPVAAPGGSPATAPAWRQATAAQAARTTSQAACRTQVAVVTAR